MTIKIELPANNASLIRAIGAALAEYEYVPDDDLLPVPGYVPTKGDEGIEVDLSDEVHITKTSTPGPSTTTIEDPAAAETPETPENPGEAPTVDEKGVMFIPAVCAVAKEPFYASGPRKGQWKKKRGIDDLNYDTVYLNAVNQVTAAATTTPATTGLSEAEEAFGDQTKTTADPAATNVTPDVVFALYSKLVQAGRPEPANAVFANHGLANGTLIYSRPELAPAIHAELLTLDQSA